MSATHESDESVNGESNSTNTGAQDGEPGLEGSIDIVAGNRIPLIPRRRFKAYASVELGSKLSVDVDLLAVSSSFARRRLREFRVAVRDKFDAGPTKKQSEVNRNRYETSDFCIKIPDA